MKRLLVISGILSWFNLVIWGFIVLIGILTALLYSNIGFFGLVFILSSIILHSFAALKLRKGIKIPGVPLGNQTPIGIRLMGAITLFLGVFYISEGIAILQNMQEVVKDLKPALDSYSLGNSKNINPGRMASGVAISSIILGLSCAGNAIVNFRMLRWYLFNTKDEQNTLK